MATINTRILLRYDTYENWSKTNVELKGGNFVLKKGEVGFCEVPSDNTAATTAPTVLFKVGDGTNAFKDLKWASALAADVYSWAKENKITIVKNGTGNVISNIEWDATANNGKGGIKFSTIDVYTKTESDNLYAKKKNANGGFEGGNGASATTGGAIGNRAKTENGGAIGDGASSLSGGAIGSGAKTSYGFAGGKDAKTIDSDGFGIDAIQLGTGTNNTVRSLQVYDYTLMNPDGSIPAERLTNAATPEELERLNYYGNKDIVPSDESYFIVHGASNSITGLTDAGKTQTELLIPYKINGVKIKRIKRSAFANCTSLTSVIIPNSVTNIGINAFSGCTSLTSVIIPNNVTSIGQSAFDGCTGLTSVIIPNSITSIGENAFSGCSSLTSINIPNSITNIGSGTFSSCTGLTSVIIPNSITSIGGNAFTHCTSLTSINIPNSVTSIGGNAFWCCSSLTSINIPNSVTGIGNDAFDGITPSQLTVYCEQGSYAETYAKNNGYNVVYTDVSDVSTTEELERLQYYGDKNIIPSDESYFVVNETGETITGLTDAGKTQTELVIPYEINGKKITTLYSEVDSMFEPQSILDGSTTITKVTIPKSVTTLGRGVFCHCTSVASINIPDSVKTIDEYAFTYCTSLTSIKLPNSITTIGENAFNNCSGLTSIEIANGIKSIGAAMFSLCSNLESIYIPDSITSIGEDAFNGCTSLKRINIPKAVTQLGEFTFDGATNLTIYCEKGAYAESYAEIFNIPVVYTDISKDTIDNLSSKEELERLQYYGDANIVPNESYFTVNGSTITGLTDTGKTQTGTLVIPYKINGIEITQLQGNIISFTSILNGATDKITKVILPNSINNIGVASFYGCTALTEINIPDSVTDIQNYAFNGCTSLASINISNSVKNIGLVTFQGCTNLKIYCEQGSYAENYAKSNGFSNIVYTDIKSTYFNNYVSKDGSNTISGTIDASSGSILVSEPTSDTQAANKKYVDDSITAGIQANDAMTFKGLLGGEGNITELPTDVATVQNGDTYKVAVDGTYNEIAAKSGDMFIALVKNSTVSWQFIPSADDGNVLANNDLTADALIVGNGSKEIKTLANGSNDQILRIVNNIPTWEKEYEVVATDTSITVTKDTENKQYKISVNSVDVNKLTQSEGTVLVLNGGNSAN